MNQKGITLLGSDLFSLIEIAKELSTEYVTNRKTKLQIYGRGGPREISITSACSFSIYNGAWLSISDWQACRETFRTWLVNSLDAIKPLGEITAISLTCLSRHLSSKADYLEISPESVIKFIEGYFTYFSPTKNLLSTAAYSGLLGKYLSLIKCEKFSDSSYASEQLRITFPISLYDGATKYTTSSVLVNLLRYPEVSFDRGKPLVGSDLLKSISKSMIAQHKLNPRETNLSPSDPLFLLWLLVARDVFPNIYLPDPNSITGPSRLMSELLSNKSHRLDLCNKITYSKEHVIDIFNNFDTTMDSIYCNGSLPEGAEILYRALKENFQRIVPNVKAVETIASTSKPSKRKVNLSA
jgi:hypothetical protein